MPQVSIGRRIAIVLGVTVVLLLCIDTSMACRWWRNYYSYAPVVTCSPVHYRVVYQSVDSCGSTVHEHHGHAADSSSDSTGDMDQLPEPAQMDEAPAGFQEVPGDTVDTPLDEPVTDAPTDQPSVDEPTVDGPEVDPLPDFPTVDPVDEAQPDNDLDSIFESDQSETPSLDEPSLDEPSLDEPSLDEPAFDEPTLDDADDDADMDDSLDDIFSETAPDPDGGEAVLEEPTLDETQDESGLDELFGPEGDDSTTDESDLDLFGDQDDASSDGDSADEELFPLDDETEDAPTEDGDDDLGDLDELFGTSSSAPPAKTGFREVTKSSQPAVEPIRDRVWTDNTGRYRTVGRLVKIGPDHVRLFKDNGRYSTVPMQRLSQRDLEYVQSVAKHFRDGDVSLARR